MSRGSNVPPLGFFDLGTEEAKTLAVESAVRMGDEYDSMQGVHFDEKFQLKRNRFLFTPGGEMARQAARSSGNRQTIVAENPQSLLEKFIHTRDKAPVAAAYDGRADGRGVEWRLDFKRGRFGNDHVESLLLRKVIRGARQIIWAVRLIKEPTQINFLIPSLAA